MRFGMRGVALVASAGLVLTACGSSSDTDTATKTEGGTITVWADETRAPILTKIGEDFKKDKGVTVKVVQKEFGDIAADLVSKGPAGQGPDVAIGPHDQVGNLVQNGAIDPVDLGDKKADYSDVSIKAMTYNGQVYGLPYAVENIALLINKKLAPECPTSWDGMISESKKLQDAGKVDLPFAIQMSGEDGDPYHFMPLQSSFGSAIFKQNSDGSYTKDLVLDDAAGVAFAKKLGELGKEKIVSTSVTGDIAKEKFNGNKVAFWVTGPWNVQDAQKAGVDVGVCPVPSLGGKTSAPFVGVQAYMVSSYSKNKLVANDFVKNYLATEAVADQMFKAGGRAPALNSAFEKAAADPIVKAFGEVGAEGAPMPNIPEMNAVWGDWGRAEGAIVAGKGDPEKVWKDAAAKIRKALGQ